MTRKRVSKQLLTRFLLLLVFVLELAREVELDVFEVLLSH